MKFKKGLRQGLYKFSSKSKKGEIEFKYVCYVSRDLDTEEKVYFQPDFNIQAKSLNELKDLLP